MVDLVWPHIQPVTLRFKTELKTQSPWPGTSPIAPHAVSDQTVVAVARHLQELVPCTHLFTLRDFLMSAQSYLFSPRQFSRKVINSTVSLPLRPSSTHIQSLRQSIMAPSRPEMDVEDFDILSLSGNESDGSYDMADGVSPEESLKNESSVSKPASEASKIEERGKKAATHDTPQGDVACKDDQAFVQEDEEPFYDMHSDQIVGKCRVEFKDHVRLMMALMNDMIGVEPSDRKPMVASLVGHSRAIASMFGDDIPFLRQKIQDTINGMAQLSLQRENLWNSKESIVLHLQKETQARHQLQILHQQTVQSALNTNAQYQKEVRARRELEILHKQAVHDASHISAQYELEVKGRSQLNALHQQTVQAGRTVTEQYHFEKNQKNALVHEVRKLQEFKTDLVKEVERYAAQIAAYKAQLQTLETEHEKQKFAKEELQAMHRKAMKAEKRKNEDLVKDNEQLEKIRQSLCEEVNTVKTSYCDAIEAVKAERNAKEAAVVEKKKFESENVQLKFALEEAKKEYSMMADTERKRRDETRAENNNLKKTCTSLKNTIRGSQFQHAAELKLESQARDSLIRQNKTLREDLASAEDREELALKEIKEFQRALGDNTKDQIEKEAMYKAGMESLEKKLTTYNTKVESMHTFVKSMVITDGKRVETTEKLNGQLAQAKDELADMEKIKDILKTSNRAAEHHLITKLLDQRKANTTNLNALSEELAKEKIVSKNGKRFGEELLRTIKTCAGLVNDKKNLTTRVVLLENDIAEAKKFRRTVRETIVSLLEGVNQVPKIGHISELFNKAREIGSQELDIAQLEVLRDIEKMIIIFCDKTTEIGTQYRRGLRPLLAPAKIGEVQVGTEESKHSAAATVAQQLMNQENAIKLLKTDLASTNTALQALKQTNIQLTASHTAALNELTERRTQVAEFEALQLELGLRGARAVAQMNQFKTEVRCLHDLHGSDVEKIREVEAKLRTVQRERDLAIATIAKKEEPEKSS
ncbi:hypothetical protein BKA61DRAFT_46825 [Leptodontidium sp. MPI-SDFR-AT-0119]|nr:hypothetical protein BKA61DRAFT_46825 [Leptodontidium sp. MPI-SDFR-AT-0119]